MTALDLSTFGEGQLRLTVPHGDRLLTTRTLQVSPAGSEANVAGLLAQLGWRTTWATTLPHGELGDRILREYRGVGVDLGHVRRSETGRVALYFLEPGDAPMPATVTYDRDHTPFRDMTPADIDWDAFLDTRLLFITGITMALTPGTAALVRYAVDAARERGVGIVLDVNHRAKLWSTEDARAALTPLLAGLSVLLCSRTDGARVFGIAGDAAAVAQELHDRTGIPHVVSTDSAHGVASAGVGGPRRYPIDPVPVTDRPGAGDAFIGGVLDGFLRGDLHDGIRRGQRAASFALTHHGDLTQISGPDLREALGTDIVR